MLSTDDMKTKPCKCGKTLQEIINTEENLRVGWWCPTCNAFEKAILRERLWR